MVMHACIFKSMSILLFMEKREKFVQNISYYFLYSVPLGIDLGVRGDNCSTG